MQSINNKVTFFPIIKGHKIVQNGALVYDTPLLRTIQLKTNMNVFDLKLNMLIVMVFFDTYVYVRRAHSKYYKDIVRESNLNEPFTRPVSSCVFHIVLYVLKDIGTNVSSL